ncbi:MAG TPA: metalloregulator ArsR/SmtB family transcription factor, partial [Gemmatimonadales bacterium]
MPRALRSTTHRAVKDGLYLQFARIGKACASPHRLELLDLLAQAERPVEALARETGLGVANTSAHLKLLYQARLVDRRRKGQQVWYRLADLAVRRLLQDLMALGRKQLAEVEQVVHRYYESPGELEPITPRELRRRLRDGDVLVLDVRPPEEFAAGHIPGAVNIPPDQLRRRLASLPRDRDIVAYCRGPFCL